MSGIRFGPILANFIQSSKDFSVIYRTGENIVPANEIKRILILDSSFNPPHLGHFSLINEALRQTYNDHETNNNREILLLLLIKNADKVKIVPESFENRLEMMYLMAQEIQNQYPTINDVTIGITKHAKFVDKSLAIINDLKSQGVYNKQILTFLLGFDTLTRIFDPVYYLPDKLSDSLNDFMKTTNLFCLTRNYDEAFDNNYQSTYLQDIKLGKHSQIPPHWCDNIYLANNHLDHVSYISSSSTRREIESGDESWKSKVIPQIRDLIVERGFYGYKGS